MKTKNNKLTTVLEMSTKVASTSLATVHSNVFEEHGEIVIATAYHTNGKFGYFVTHEFKRSDGHFEYRNHLAFYPKENERTYKLAAEKLKDVLAAKQQ